MAGRISDELLGSKMFLYGAGRIDEEIERPYVGICSTWTEHFPGHNHLDKLAKAVSDGVYRKGEAGVLDGRGVFRGGEGHSAAFCGGGGRNRGVRVGDPF